MDQVEEDLKRMKIVGWRAKVEDRQEWNRIVEQTETHPGRRRRRRRRKRCLITKTNYMFRSITAIFRLLQFCSKRIIYMET